MKLLNSKLLNSKFLNLKHFNSKLLNSKHFNSVLLSLTLAFSLCVPAGAVKMVQTFSTDYFQLLIPGDWVIDTSTAADYWGMLDFGFMYSEDETMLIEAKMNYYSDWAEDSLWIADDGTWEDYMAFILDDFKDESPEVVTRFSAGKYPGVMITGTNDYGSYLFGEVMINAYAFDFYFYLLNADGTINSDISEDDVEFFQSIMETFSPTYINSPAGTAGN